MVRRGYSGTISVGSVLLFLVSAGHLFWGGLVESAIFGVGGWLMLAMNEIVVRIGGDE